MTHYQSEQMKGVWRIHMYMYIHGIHSNPTIDSSIFKNLTVIIFVWELMQIGIPNIYVQSGYWMILNQCNVYISEIFSKIQKIYNLITGQTIPSVCTGIPSTMLDALFGVENENKFYRHLPWPSFNIYMQEDPKGGKQNSTWLWEIFYF